RVRRNASGATCGRGRGRTWRHSAMRGEAVYVPEGGGRAAGRRCKAIRRIARRATCCHVPAPRSRTFADTPMFLVDTTRGRLELRVPCGRAKAGKTQGQVRRGVRV